ncbi:MAG: TIGR01212 family radical SAM protein [Candidatus Lambdaproteobacteria bacterium]|nr:TIGR01212 family radical SAM protein [Candidatus Lambdaproteobacteria bacterium]
MDFPSAAAAAPRYRPLSAHYAQRFGCKVYKVTVSVAETCPNRQGQGGSRVCIFCDAWGAAAHPRHAAAPLRAQIEANMAPLRTRYGAQKFLVYFQAYTNTFARLATLERLFDEALQVPDVVGLVIGTRPDCLPPRTVALLEQMARHTYVGVELGVQTLDDVQLRWLSRMHDAACSLRAMETLLRHARLDVCAHLMFGLPGETPAQLARTAARLSALGVHGVKLHNLHVLRNTPLAGMYEQRLFTPVDLAIYTERVIGFLEHLSPRVAVHRLSAVASRWDEVLAPDWVRHKLAPAMFILGRMAERDTWQGRAAGGTRAQLAAPIPHRTAGPADAAAQSVPATCSPVEEVRSTLA